MIRSPNLPSIAFKPIEGARLKDPIGNLDIKRWAQAMHYPNGLQWTSK